MGNSRPEALREMPLPKKNTENRIATPVNPHNKHLQNIYPGSNSFASEPSPNA